MALKKDTWSYRLALALGPRIYLILERLLFSTCRMQEYDAHFMESCEAEGQGPHIAVLWHYSLFHIVHKAREKTRQGRPYVVMVSGSEDGEFAARILERLGCPSVRGSRFKGGLGALRAMVGRMEKGLHAAIVADGSQGPPRKVQGGVILLASRTGAPILPMAVSASRFFTFKSWDRTMLPLPFSRFALVYGEPMHVPRKLGSEDIEYYRVELEARMNGLYEKAWALFDKKGHV